MRQLSLAEFKDRLPDFDDLMAKTHGVDHFCSSSNWVLSAYEAFAQEDASPWIFEGEHGFVVLYQSWNERIGRFAQPLEASWCLASPFATEHPVELAAEFFDEMYARRTEWDLLFLAGMMRDVPLYQALISKFASHYFVGAGPGVSRQRASLEGGLEGFLSRRTSKFRANLRRLQRRATEQGVVVESVYSATKQADDWEAVYARILALEAKSWKGEIDSGIKDGHMKEFYRRMLPRLAAQGKLRVMFLTRDGEDIAFIFGAVHHGLYRGLQVSFHNAHRKMSPGNLAQINMIEALCGEELLWYDLGSELAYKSKWSEQITETVPLVIRPW